MRAVFLCVGFLWSGIVHADMIAQLDLTHIKSDAGDMDRVNGSYYFSPVRTSDGPLLLATFLQRADSVGLKYEHQGDQNTYAVDGTYNHAKSGWFVSGSASRSTLGYTLSTSSTSFQQVDYIENRFKISIGKYVFKETTLAVGYTRNIDRLHNLFESSLPNLPPAILDTGAKTRIGETSVRLRHVGRVRNLFYELTGDCVRALVSTESSTAYVSLGSTKQVVNYGYHSIRCFVGARLFPTTRLSIGISDEQSHTGPAQKTIGYSIEWFPVDSWLVRLAYEKTDNAPIPIPPPSVAILRPVPALPPFNPNFSGFATATPSSASPVTAMPIYAIPGFAPRFNTEVFTFGISKRF